MPTPVQLPSFKTMLRDILKNKPGIFLNTQAHPLSKNFTDAEREELHPEQFTELAILEDLESRFKSIAAAKGISTANLPININIAVLKDNISAFEKKELPASGHQKQFSHLGIFLSLDDGSAGTLPGIGLIMFGVKLDDSRNADLTLTPNPISDTEFSDFQPLPTSGSADPRNAAHLLMRRKFINLFKATGRRIVHGVYIRLRSSANQLDILKVLDKLSAEGADTVKISMGFYSQEASPDPDTPNCLHLIFRGNKPGSTFSTWDGEGYTGPTPACPPFGCNSNS